MPAPTKNTPKKTGKKSLETGDMSIEQKIIFMNQLKQRAKNAEAEAKRLQAEIIEEMQADGKDKISTDDFDCTLVTSSTATWNTAMIRDILSDKEWMKVTERQLDVGKLEDAVAKGIIPQSKIAPAVEVKDRAPYIRVTLKAKEA